MGRKGKSRTNVDFVTELMNGAQSGRLMQMFVMNALDLESQRVIDMAAKGPIEMTFINPATWVACAEEIQAKFKSWNRFEPERKEEKAAPPWPRLPFEGGEEAGPAGEGNGNGPEMAQGEPEPETKPQSKSRGRKKEGVTR